MTPRMAHATYRLGIVANACYSGDRVEWVRWRGRRGYVLGWPTDKWRCLLRYHHWPTPWTVGFGMCGKCAPWPCCGAVTSEHAPGCRDQP